MRLVRRCYPSRRTSLVGRGFTANESGAPQVRLPKTPVIQSTRRGNRIARPASREYPRSKRCQGLELAPTGNSLGPPLRFLSLLGPCLCLIVFLAEMIARFLI